MLRRMRTTLFAAMCALVTAGLAAAAAGDALRCHPDPRGTRSLAVDGQVTGYAFEGGRVRVDWVRGTCAGTSAWDFAASSRATASASCRHAAASSARGPATRLVAAQGDRVVRVLLAPASVDRPDRLEVLDRATDRQLASWPLFERPTRVALDGGIAVLSTAHRGAVYALRLSDGRIAMLGIARAGDRPVIGAEGVVYQDALDLSMQRTSPNVTTLKLLRLSTVRRELAAPGARQIGTSRINAIAMDGKRVAFVVHDPAGMCDKVLFWSIPWHFVSRLTQKVGPTCLPTHAAGGITNVAIAGDRAAWTTTYGGRTRVLAASIINCVEWVVARPVAGDQRVAGLSGDGGVLAFALGRGSPSARQTSSVGLVPGAWRPVEVARSNAQVVGISADRGRVAALYSSGTVSVVARDGRLDGRLDVGSARAIALGRRTLAVLRRGALDVYATRPGRLAHSWRVPVGATSVDLQYGIAVVTSGRDVVAVNTQTGRTARLLRAPGRAAAQIEAPGVVVQFNVGERGYLRFIPMSVVEARTA